MLKITDFAMTMVLVRMYVTPLCIYYATFFTGMLFVDGAAGTPPVLK
jgi:hypothetical protein